MILKTISFKMKEIENLYKSDGSKNLSSESSVSFKNWEFEESKIKTTDFFDNGKENLSSICLNGKPDEPIQITKPTILLPKPSVMFSPRPIIELDAAAIKVQKVYKSYRTRRNLADCAVVVEELWWQALDFAALKRSSFFNVEKHESASSRWGRARTRAAKVGKGSSKNKKAQKLALQHWLEAIDPRHRYGHNLHFYYDMWFDSKSTQPFFYWLDVGDGKEVNIGKCPRIDLHCQCIEYLGPSERKAYEVIVECGKLVFNQNGMLLNTIKGSKWIFVLSTSRALYVGKKKKGMFQHSSFLSGGAITSAGRLVAHDGVLEAIWPYSGHYLPTEENFKEFISFLQENHVDLTNVKRCSTDDDQTSSPVTSEESKLPDAVESHSSAALLNTNVASDDESINKTSIATVYQEVVSMSITAANVEAPVVFDLVTPLSCKWTSGVGPRIGCVRGYPTELRRKALEQVNLTPKVAADAIPKRVPIPSPRPSPKIRVSPRLAYMGLPSPRVSFTCAT